MPTTRLPILFLIVLLLISRGRGAQLLEALGTLLLSTAPLLCSTAASLSRRLPFHQGGERKRIPPSNSRVRGHFSRPKWDRVPSHRRLSSGRLPVAVQISVRRVSSKQHARSGYRRGEQCMTRQTKGVLIYLLIALGGAWGIWAVAL